MKHSPPIVFAVSIPINAQNRGAGIEFIRLMLSEEGKEVLRGLGLDPIQPAEGIGEIPPELTSLVPWEKGRRRPQSLFLYLPYFKPGQIIICMGRMGF